MRSLGGLVLLAGIGFGLFVYLPAPGNDGLSLDSARDSARRSSDAAAQPQVSPAHSPAAGTAASTTRVAGIERSFAPGVSLAGLAPAGAGSSSDTSGGWQSVVSASGSLRPSSAQSLAPESPRSRYELTVEIQKHLKRLGCYYGRIDGSWGIGSKEAMRTFTERANAALPVDKPDPMLLSLLQSHSGKPCAECPHGLTLSSGGSCVARPAYARSQGGGETLPWKSANADRAEPAAPPVSTTAQKPLFRPVTSSVVSSQPLPGRMSIGGPKQLPPVNAYNAASGYSAANPAGTAPSTTAAFDDADGASQAAASAHKTPKRQATVRSRHRSSDPIRHNLMLSLGGAY